MYCPSHFQETRPEILQSLMAQHPLATVVSWVDEGLCADHIPLLFENREAGQGVLIGHVARSNPLWRHAAGREVLAVFQGPSTYISPNWYTTKAVAGKVVPTWNYAVVHVHGTLRALEQPQEILPILNRLTDTHEARQAHPWKVADAPPEFTERLLEHIVGIEISVSRIVGKWKISQNQPAENRQSVLQGLALSSDPESQRMAEFMGAHRP